MKLIEEQIKVLSKGTEEIISLEELKEKLQKSQQMGRPLVVKLGLDPSAPDIHLGHTVVLRKMKQFQDLGHKVIIIIGDFTGMIGDPTGKSKTRKQLTVEEVLINAETYKEQIFKVLDKDKTEVRFNSEWLSKLNFSEVIELSSKYTVSRMLEREDFKNRMVSQLPISIHEFFYPLMQGYDSVAIKADVELGATEQKFNILMGRTLQREYNQEKQIALFMPILEGTDGVEKMSKSLGNYIGINEDPVIMYEKTMTIPDNLIVRYFELVTDIHPDEVERIKASLETNEVNPRDIKMRLAREIVTLYHGEKAALEAEEHFKTVFQKGLVPEDIKELEITEDMDLIKIIVSAGFAPSTSEARRLIQQGAVKINGEKIIDFKVSLKDNDVVQVGKKNFVRLIG
jgi:tyrosyl-tRNA synthetase